MKHFIIAFLCLLSTAFYAQKDKTIYLDSVGLETKYGSHKTYRVIKDYLREQKTYNVLEYYKSGELKSEGIYSDNHVKSKEGFFTNYYKNGKAKSRLMYTENLAYGDYISWHENGNKAIEGEYIIDNYAKSPESNLKIKNYWDENGTHKIIDGNGVYTEMGELETAVGELKNGYKTGVWEGASQIGNVTFKETYKNGKLVEGSATDQSNNTYSYTKKEANAEPKNGLPNFRMYIGTSVNIPEVKDPAPSIKLLFRFTIDETGKIIDIETLKGYSSQVDKAFIQVLKNSPTWNPAYHRGKILRSHFTLPITIQTN